LRCERSDSLETGPPSASRRLTSSALPAAAAAASSSESRLRRASSSSVGALEPAGSSEFAFSACCCFSQLSKAPAPGFCSGRRTRRGGGRATGGAAGGGASSSLSCTDPSSLSDAAASASCRSSSASCRSSSALESRMPCCAAFRRVVTNRESHAGGERGVTETAAEASPPLRLRTVPRLGAQLPPARTGLAKPYTR
jgi:hypothetical protein